MRLSHQFIVVGILLFIAILVKCKKKQDPIRGFDIETHLESYDDHKTAIQKKQADWQEYYTVASPSEQKSVIQKSRNYLNKQLYEVIFPAWYGTPWDFNGTTQTPRQGKIACGYFVTTTLEHVGFKLPRIKMAQQAASVIIQSLCDPASIQSHKTMESLTNYMAASKDGLFILGLDKHVGYVYKEGDQNYFIHASLSNGRKVIKEKLETSKSIVRSKVKMIGTLTGYDGLIKKWIAHAFINLKK